MLENLGVQGLGFPVASEAGMGKDHGLPYYPLYATPPPLPRFPP